MLDKQGRTVLPPCRCGAYSFPHKERGGKCRGFVAANDEDEGWCGRCDGSSDCSCYRDRVRARREAARAHAD